MDYDAFISYSHAQDSDLAPHLETALEKFAKPLFKQRALYIFRDANDLSASPNLWGKIEEGLKNSEYFIFMASPKAALSKWCKKEVDYWKANKDMAKFLIVMTDGELSWDESKSDFDWSKTTAIPSNLSGAFVNEPLFVDFRNHKNEESGLEYPDFRAKTVLLAATIHGKSVGNMIGENVKQHKKTLRIRNATIAILSALLITVGFAGYYANFQKNVAIQQSIEAKRQKKEALHHANRALAKSYLSDSKANLSEDPTLSMKLATMAYKFAKSDSMDLEPFEDQLILSFNNTGHFYVAHEGFELKKDTSFIDTIRYEHGDVKITYDPYKNKNEDYEYSEEDFQLVIDNAGKKAIIQKDFGENLTYSLSANGKHVIEKVHAKGFGNYRLLNTLSAYDLDGKQIAAADNYYPDVPLIRFNSDCSRFVLSGNVSSETAIIDENQKKRILNNRSDVTDLQISPNGNMVVIGYSNGDIELFQLYDNYFAVKNRWILKGHKSEAINALKFDSKGRYIYSQSNTIKRKWFADTNKPFIMLNDYPTYHNTLLGAGTTRYEEGQVWFTDQNTYLEFHKVVDNDVVETYAEFNDVEDVLYGLEQNHSSDNRYIATRNGLFNSKSERLIAFSFPPHPERTQIIVTAFSRDLKYVFASRNIYLLDPELILKRFHDATKIGNIESFTKEERAQYMIPEDY